MKLELNPIKPIDTDGIYYPPRQHEVAVNLWPYLVNQMGFHGWKPPRISCEVGVMDDRILIVRNGVVHTVICKP